jgi:hypothetical protein
LSLTLAHALSLSNTWVDASCLVDSPFRQVR